MGSRKRTDKVQVLQNMVGKLTSCFQSLQRRGMRLGSVSQKGNTFWGLLKLVHDHGPMTVPQIAMHRKVSRQRIQVMVDEYVSGGYLQFSPNPSHKRSQLVKLTVKGESEFSVLSDSIFSYLDQASHEFRDEELQTTLKVLEKLQSLIEKS